MQLFINNWASALTLPASASAVELSVDPSAAALLVGLGGGDHYLLTLATVDGVGNETAWEIVRVTDKTDGLLDVVRGQEGTAALDLEAGAAISARLTRESMEALQVAGSAWGGITGTLADQTDLVAALSGKASSAQGALADSAVQPGDLAAVATSGDYDDLTNKPTLGTAAATAATDYATAAQGALADSAVQPAALAEKEQVLTAGANVTIDRTDPDNPVISASVSGGGGGDVVGPASATANAVALYNGTTGKLIKDGPVLGTAAESNTGDFTPAAHAGAGGAAHADVVAGGASGFMTGAQAAKVDGIATGATANDTDANLKNRANHTGTQAQSTVTNLTTDLAAKQATLVSGTNIKTVNGASVLGSGDLTVSAAPAPVITESTTSRTLGLTDAGAYIRHTNASASTVTVAPQASVVWAANTEISIRRAAAGNLTLTPGSGVTLNAPAGGTLVMTNAMSVTLKRVTADEWDVIGQTVAV